MSIHYSAEHGIILILNEYKKHYHVHVYDTDFTHIKTFYTTYGVSSEIRKRSNIIFDIKRKHFTVPQRLKLSIICGYELNDDDVVQHQKIAGIMFEYVIIKMIYNINKKIICNDKAIVKYNINTPRILNYILELSLLPELRVIITNMYLSLTCLTLLA